jgi:transposase
MRRYELYDNQWDAIKELFPDRVGKRGRPGHPPRQILNGILWVLCSGAPWRDLPERYGPCKTVYHRFRQWQKSGLFDQILALLHLKLNAEGLIDWDLWAVDATVVKASKAAAGAKKKPVFKP